MKQFLLLFTLLPTLLTAQNNKGTITYEERIKIKIDSSWFKDMPEGMGDMIMKRMKNRKPRKKILFFTQAESLFRNYDRVKDGGEEPGTEEEHGNMRMRWSGMRPETRIYQSFADTTVIEQSEFMDKKFLITGSDKRTPWKLTGEKDTVMGHFCMKASYEKDTTTVYAWFTPMIPVSGGPGELNGLPGMILRVQAGDGMYTLEAVDVKFEQPADDAIAKPKGGKEVTREEYNEIVEEKMKEMKEMYGGGKKGGGARIMMIPGHQ